MNLSRIVAHWADHTPGRTAIHFQGADLSYAALWARISQATNALAALGIAPGDRVAMLAYNCPEILVALLALSRLGALLVPLNWRLTVAEHRLILADCAPKLLLAEDDWRAHAEQLPVPMQPLQVLDGPAEAAPEAGLVGSDAEDALVVYTSGTTGKPKGAVLTQAGLIWNAYNAIAAHDMGQQDHALNALPMFHVGGLNIQGLPVLVAGARVTLHRRFDPGQWLADVAAHRPTLSVLVPAMMAAIVGHPAWARADLSSLRMIHAGSMIVPDSLIQAFHARGIPVGQIYGSTETAPCAIVLLREDAERKLGSAGKPALHCEVRLVANPERTADVAEGVGEVWVRGPNVMRGYWNAPEATRAALADGWYRTGDLARRDADGFYWIVGRSKDVIISGGENIYPAELENVLADCPAIAEAAVVGIADARWGETVCACIVRAPGAALDEDGVLALFRERLARYKHPRRVLFMDTLPKTAMGKVQKFALRKAVESRG
jgi:fatty-acyl-CoA synthase